MTIAIVDGYSTGAALAARLHHLGVPCAHIQSQPDNHDFLRRTYNPAHYTRDFGFVPDLGTLAERLRREGTTRVVAGSESGVTTAEALSHALGLPTNAPEQSAARRDKNLMAATVRAAGLATPRRHLAASPTTAAQWFATSGLPEAVVKPLASAGSDGVRFCRTPADVHDATRTVLDSRNIFGQPNTTALVQERLLGTEYYINTVTLNGRHKVAEIWRYTKQVRPGAGPVYDYEEPVPANTPEARLLRAYTFAVLDALGIRNSPAHTEVMLTATGPVLIETGARLGGATSPTVVEQHCGISQTALAAAALAAPKAFDDFDDRHLTWTGALRNVEFINHRAGRADRAAMLRAAALPSAVEVCPAPSRSAQPSTTAIRCGRPPTCSARPDTCTSPRRRRSGWSATTSRSGSGSGTGSTPAAWPSLPPAPVRDPPDPRRPAECGRVHGADRSGTTCRRVKTSAHGGEQH